MTISIRQEIKKVLAPSGGEWVDLPSLLPASTVIELAGEALRSRLYFATSPDGEELCLRADLTIPAALKYIESADIDNMSATYLCEGKVYRASPNGEHRHPEFTQIGIERFGTQDEIQTDVEVFLSAITACKIGEIQDFAFEFSDGGLIDTILDGAFIYPPWKEYLKSSSKSPNSLKRALKIACLKDKQEPTALETSLLGQDDEAASNTIEEVIELAKLRTGLARGPYEIAQRLKSRAERALAKPLKTEIKSAIEEILAIEASPKKAIKEIVKIAKNLGVDLSNWSKTWEKRLAEIAKKVPEIEDNSRFVASKNGRFEYYSGFAFDIFAKKDTELPLATGGRYDGLIAALTNGGRNAQAMGVVIRPERLGG